MILWLVACGGGSFDQNTASAPMPMVAYEQEEAEGDRAYRDEGGAMPAAKSAPAGLESRGFILDDSEDAPAPPPAPASEPEPVEAGGGEAARAWFPETFVWAPAVVTGSDGSARVDAVLPDSLTTWRVLGLAADRQGAQAGEVLRIASTLPTYADPVAPDWLRAGDRAVVPIRLVNTTGGELASSWTARATGLEGAGGGTVVLPAGRTTVVWADLQASAPGSGRFEVALEGLDRVIEDVAVLPRGQARHQQRRGVLGSAGSFELAAPEGASFTRVQLTLFPGPLGVLRHALERRAGGAVAYALGVQGEQLLEQLGASVDDARRDALRRLRLLGLQELTLLAQSGQLQQRLRVLDALRRGEQDRVAESTAAGLRELVALDQLPDGSFSGADTLQATMVLTATAARVADRPEVSLGAAAFFERQGSWLLHEDTGDAYTAAQVLRSGVVDGELAAQLQAFVVAAVDLDGELASVQLPADVEGLGGPVSEAEALAVVATVVDDDDVRDALLAAIVAGYAPAVGLGSADRALATLDALARATTGLRPDQIEVALKLDGELVARHELRGDALTEVAVVQVPGPTAGTHRYEVVSDTAWPGLGWEVELQAWVPWTASSDQGVQFELERAPMSAGAPASQTLVLSGVPGQTVDVRQELPAGVELVGAVSGAEDLVVGDGAWTGEVELDGAGLATLTYRVSGTLAGELWSGPITASARGEVLGWHAPELWRIGTVD